MKKIKRILSICLSLVMIVCMFPIYSSAASYTADYKNWSQGASDNAKMRAYGCWVVSQAKLIAETGINNSSSFNPDVLMNWQFSNSYLDSGFYQTNGGYAPVAYAKSLGNNNLQYLGVTTSGTTAKIWDNISNGYYSIIKVRTSSGGTHYCMIANSLSASNGTLYMYDTWSQSSNYGPRKMSYSMVTAVYSYSYSGGSVTTPPSYVSVSEASYTIINKASGKYLNAYANAGAAKSGTNICASNSDNSAEQKFKIQAYGNNQYYIRSLSNGNEFCVNAESGSTVKNGANVSLYNYNTVSSKLWYFEDAGGGYYIIRNVMNSNLVLTAVSYDARANVCVKTFSGSDLQKWQLVDLTETSTSSTVPSTSASSVCESNFNIINKSSQKYLNAYAYPGQATAGKVSSGTGTNVCTSNTDGTMEQVWKIEHYGDNKYYIRSCSNSGFYCVNAWSPQNVVSNGADVRLYNYNTTSSKHWTFEDAGDGYYIIRNVMNSQLVLTADSNAHQANVCVKTYSGSDLQKWKLVDLINKSKPVEEKFYVDLNGYWNGTEQGTIDGVGTADVYINGTLVADDVSDFYAAYPSGTTYEFKDIKGTNGYSYIGLYAGSLTGTLTNSKLRGVLSFEKSESFNISHLNTDTVFNFINKSSGKHLNAYADNEKVTVKTNVCASNGDGSKEQNFKLQSVGDGKYLIRSLSNANLYCVDVYTPDNVAKNDSNVWMYYNTDFASKHWYFDNVGEGCYVIRNALNTNLVLAAVSNEHRANVTVQTYTGSDLQKWRVENVNPYVVTSTGNTVSQKENIQKLNNVIRKWINISCPFSLDVSTSKTQIIDYKNPPSTMDCSSFTSSIYLTVFGVDIGRNTRMQQYRGAPVGIEKAKSQDFSELEIGDLILFDWGGDGVPDHVGIYSGNGNYIHMTTNNKVAENAFSYKSRYNNILTIRRIIQQDGSLHPWIYTTQGDDEACAVASTVVNNDVPYYFDKDEQTITGISSETTYSEILLNTEYDKIVVLNSNGGEIVSLTRDELTTGDYVLNDKTILPGTIANFYDTDGNLAFTAECVVDGDLGIITYGDVNGDGEADEVDAMTIYKYIVGWSIELDMQAADTYKDGYVDELDAMNILKCVVGWDVVLG